MTSQRPYTYNGLRKKWLSGGKQPFTIRPNTTVNKLSDDSFSVALYGHFVVIIYSDGRVALNRCGHPTNTTRNRMNDALSSLGWSVRIVDGLWFLRANDGRTVPYQDGMVVTDSRKGN